MIESLQLSGFQLPSLLEGQHSLDGDMVRGEPLVWCAARRHEGGFGGHLEHASTVEGVGAVEDVVHALTHSLVVRGDGWLRALKPRGEKL